MGEGLKSFRDEGKGVKFGEALGLGVFVPEWRTDIFDDGLEELGRKKVEHDEVESGRKGGELNDRRVRAKRWRERTVMRLL